MKMLPAALAVSLLLALTSAADAKHARHHKHHAKPAPAANWRADEASLRQQPARMIEVKPGYWISSFGCAHDAGYGRLAPCDLTDGNH